MRDHIKKHFGRSPDKYPIVGVSFPHYRRACLAIALSKFAKEKGCASRLIGIASYEYNLSLNDLIHPDKSAQQLDGPLHFSDFPLSNGRSINIASQALYLIWNKSTRLIVYIREPDRFDDQINVEVMARKSAAAQEFIADLKSLMDTHSIYRGKVIAMKNKKHGSIDVSFKALPNIQRSEVILPEETLTQIDKHTSLFSKHQKLLISHKQHLKRGLLLYGPPGTGKTHTIMHIISSMPERTTVLMNGGSMGILEDACALARSLQPATIVIDDVDLIAEERSRGSSNSLLFDLLNEMDGVAEDSDVLFLLSTNRPEILEPALASRPGRVDQAILIPLPNEDCRRRLFEHYSAAIPASALHLNSHIKATNGVTSSYIRELFRRAVLIAAEEGDDLALTDKHLEDALGAMNSGGSLLTKLRNYKEEETVG